MRKALFIISLLFLCFTAEAAEGFKLVGGATAMGWPGDPAADNAGYVLTDNGDGLFVYEGMLYPANGNDGHDGEFKFMVKENGVFGGWETKQLHPMEQNSTVGTETAVMAAGFDGSDDRKWTVVTTGWYRITVAESSESFTVTAEFIDSPFRIVGGAYKGWSTGPENTLALSYSADETSALYSAEGVLTHTDNADVDNSAFKLLTDTWEWMPCVCANEPYAAFGAFAPFEGQAVLRTSESEPDNKWLIANTGLYEVKLKIDDNAAYTLSAQYVPSLTVISGDNKVVCSRNVDDNSVVFSAEFDATNDGYALLLGHADDSGNGWYLIADNSAPVAAFSENGDTPTHKAVYCNIDQARLQVAEGSYTLSADLSDWNAPSVRVEGNGTTTGLNDIAADNEVPAEFYTLTGVKVEAPLAPGIYIVRRTTTTKKMVIR